MTFGVEKLEWFGYQTVKQFKLRLFVSTECTNVTDRQTDRQTGGQTDRHRMHDGIGRACIEAHGKNDHFDRSIIDFN